MAHKRRKIKLSSSRLAQLRRQARINFGLTKKRNNPRRRNNPKKMPRRIKRRSSRSRGIGTPQRLMALAIGAGVYGGLRPIMSNFLRQFTGQIPLGNIADEAVLATIGYQMARRARTQLFKDIGLGALAVEASRIGNIFLSGTLLQAVPTAAGAPAARGTTIG